MLKLIVAVAVLIVAVLAIKPVQPVVTQELVDSINRIPGNTWKASAANGHLITGATKEQIKGLLGVKKNPNFHLPKRVFTEKENLTVLPAEFDSATNWPDCPTITNIRDQSACGSCWAVAAAEAMSDRYCVGKVNSNLEISADDLMSCCWYCGSGCEGGDPDSAWSWWTSTGLVAETCQPYPFPKCDHHGAPGPYPPCPAATYPTPSCSSTCTDSGTYTLYKGKSSYSLSGENDFMKELYTNGPFEVAFSVYEDFVTYTSGVYIQKSNQYLGGHAVRIVGWGELNNVKYWKIANSWNQDWGMNGYFLIERGTDMCGIEDAGSAGLA